jgi:LmbE family N-acetylglucosaminyl deacetylase
MVSSAQGDPKELHDVVDPAEHDAETSLPPATIEAEVAAKDEPVPEPGPKRIAVVFAHPDDAEFGVAGTVARWVKEGHTVIYVSLTSGGQGGEDPNVRPEDLATIREAEQLAASEILGVSETIFLRLPDGSVTADLETRALLVKVFRTIKPDVVVAMDPSFLWSDSGYINHPDHRATGQVTLDAIFPGTGNPMAYPELHAAGLPAHKIREVYLTAAKDPDVWIDITDTIDTKLRALRAHVSQLGDWDPDKEMREWGRENAKKQPGIGEYAESFKYFKLE